MTGMFLQGRRPLPRAHTPILVPEGNSEFPESPKNHKQRQTTPENDGGTRYRYGEDIPAGGRWN